MAILTLNKGNFGTHGGQVTMVESIAQARASGGGYSTESAELISALTRGDISDVSFESAFQGITTALNLSDKDKANNVNGLLQASVIWQAQSSPSEFLKIVNAPTVSMEAGTKIAASYGAEYDTVYSPESFDNQVLTDYMDVSIGLAYTTGRQSPGMEAIYRTIALTPEQGGVDITVPVLYNANTIEHPADGNPANWNMRRIIDSSIDPSIVRNVSTKVIPTHNAQTAAKFVAGITPWEVVDGNREVTTSFMRVRTDIDLMNLGMLDTVSKVGNADYTEALDRNVGMDRILATLGGESIAFDILGVPYTRFVKSVEKGNRRLQLSVDLSSFELNKSSKAYNGDDLTAQVFQTIADNDYKVRLKVNLYGHVDVERGVVNITPGNITVLNIHNAAGALLDLTVPGSPQAGIVTALANMTIEGFTLDAWLINSNHRHLGLMLDVRSERERLLTRTRSPVFVPFPTNEERNQTVLDQLTFTTLQQKEADGIEQLTQYHARLMAYTGGLRGQIVQGDFELNSLPIEGIGRWLINPYIQTASVDLSNTQSLDTLRAIANGQETLLNNARSVWFDILQTTNYENAARYIDGGELKHQFRPVFFTTERLKRFMTVQGDSRTLGAEVPFEIYSTVNQTLLNIEEDTDAMYMVIVRDGDGLDPLTAGCCLTTPSLVSTLQISRNNRTNKEVVYQPRYAHYNLCPIVVMFKVKGVGTLLEQALPYGICQVCPPPVDPVDPVDPEVDPVDPEDSGSGAG